MFSAVRQFEPETIIHFAEQRSAPYSMIDRKHAVSRKRTMLSGTLHVLFAIRELQPDCHLIKLGTMGEYGTPNIDIEEGYIISSITGGAISCPSPNSLALFITCLKWHDSHNMMFACKIWGLRATDLNQGVVYGTTTDEVGLDEA